MPALLSFQKPTPAGEACGQDRPTTSLPPLFGSAGAFAAGLLLVALVRQGGLGLEGPQLFRGAPQDEADPGSIRREIRIGILLLSLGLLLLGALHGRVRRCLGSPKWRSRGRALAGRVGRLAIPALLGIAAAPPLPPPPLDLPPGPLAIEGTIVGAPRPRLSRRGGGAPIETRLRLERVQVGGVAQRGSLDLIVAGDLPCGRGDRVEIEGRAIAPGLVRVPTSTAVISSERSIAGSLDRARRALRLRFRTQLSRRAAGWSSALLLGDRGLLPQATVATFRRVGQGHLLAISGLHVGLLYALARALGRRTPGPGRPRHALGLALLLLLYSGVAGGDPPVLRAAIFAALAIAISRRSARPRLPELWITSFLVLGAATRAGHEIGFWLSFSAVAAIALVIERTAPRDDRQFLRSIGAPGESALRRTFRRVGRAWKIATAAWLGATAVLVHATPELVPAGPLFSLLLAPWLAAMLMTSLLVLIPGIDFLAAPLLDGLARAGEATAAALDHLPATPALLPPIPPFAASAIALALLALLARAPRSALCLVTVATLITLAKPPSLETRLVSHDLGRGQGVFLLGRSASLLFDAGSVDRAAGGGFILRNALWREGRRSIDALFLSHPHADHVLATPELLASLDVGRVIVGPRFRESPLGASILAAVERRGVPWQSVAAGSRLEFGEFRVEVLHPPRSIPEAVRLSTNDDSLVLLVRGEGVHLLAPGDLEGIGLASVPPPPGVHTLLLPHHGRDAPGLDAWLARCRPRVAVSCGGSPSGEIRAVIESAGGRCVEISRDSPLDLRPEARPP